jgi:hypothetical protein
MLERNPHEKSRTSIDPTVIFQKLDLMVTFWADLARDEKKLESPAWHGGVLKERQAAYAAGKLTASDWELAKKRIKKKIS